MKLTELRQPEFFFQADLYSPETVTEDLPFLIYLHGAGERGTNIDHIDRHGIPRMIREGAEIGAYVLCPQLAELTQREMDVLKLLLENKKRKEIAEELFVTENTVKKHTAHIYEKLEIADRSELLLKLGGTKL